MAPLKGLMMSSKIKEKKQTLHFIKHSEGTSLVTRGCPSTLSALTASCSHTS